MPKPFYLVGPTAVGKTDLALRAAELCGAEIINADAFQVYAGLACLTAQPSAEARSRVRHHLVGHIPLGESYNVARFQVETTACLRDLAARGRPALVVGGGGLYVKALTHGLSPLPPAQPELRAELEATDLPALMARLQELDPVAAVAIDRHNKRRVVRAVEVCIATGQPFSEQRTAWQGETGPVRGMLLVRGRDELAARIHHRTKVLLEEPSLGEVRDALSGPISDTAAGIIGLSEIAAWFAGEIDRTQCLDRIETATRRYAKRQMTWFRRESFQDTVDLTSHGDLDALAHTLAAKIVAG